MRRVTLDLSQVGDPAVKAALQELARATAINVINDVAASGAALVTLKNAAANQVAYFTGATSVALTAFAAAARSLLGLTAAANKVPYFTDASTAGLLTLGTAASNLVQLDGSAKLPDAVLKNASYISVDRNNVAQAALATSVYSKIQFNNKVADPNSAYDAVTNFRYNPQVAGKYLISAQIIMLSQTMAAGTVMACSIFKNGANTRQGSGVAAIANPLVVVVPVVAVADLNGSTDYIEIFCWHNAAGSLQYDPNPVNSYMGALRVGA